MDLLEKIKERAASELPNVIALRRHLHANPELSFEEYKTALFVEHKLQEAGITEVSRMAHTGIVALIKGRNPGKKITALRADLDALPITELNDVEYRSKNEGVMHACGHDVHTSCLLGAAKILNDLRDEWEGTVKLIFQPGEEKLPGGASIMIREGVLQDPEPATIYGQHVMPFIPAGKVGFRPGLYMASTDELYLTVKGKGGHGAMPHLNIDPVVIAAHIIIALQQIVSRHASPIIPSVLSFGKITAAGSTNVIPSEVKLEGTFRTLNEEWRDSAHEKMIKMAEHLAEGMGGSCEFRIERGYPFLKNNEALTANAKQAAVEYLGAENVVDLDMWMAGEDFAFYSREIPACFYRLGTRNEEEGIISSVHTPTFNVDESALQTGMGLMAWIAARG
jgi:amidohydrolase